MTSAIGTNAAKILSERTYAQFKLFVFLDENGLKQTVLGSSPPLGCKGPIIPYPPELTPQLPTEWFASNGSKIRVLNVRANWTVTVQRINNTVQILLVDKDGYFKVLPWSIFPDPRIFECQNYKEYDQKYPPTKMVDLKKD
ncbi:MAG: hypothetical protein NT091_00405 [Candidatus Falkowbacteria bacterium]|nr:hypothetical protein [Candidatus Falkowbacteria bacterium]